MENRLFKIAERVGLPAHGLSKSFFDIADPLSRLLIQIEMGSYDTALPPSVPCTTGSLPDWPGTGPPHDHHALDRHHRPRREGAESGGELVRT